MLGIGTYDIRLLIVHENINNVGDRDISIMLGIGTYEF